MSIIQNWVKKTAITAKETVQQATRDDAQNALDVAGDICKVGIFLLMAIGIAKGVHHPAPPVMHSQSYIPPIAVYNYYFGKREDLK